VIADAIPQAPLLIDSRDPARYRGEYEPIDPVAGHIPGAMNHFWKLNLDTTGRLLSPDRLREHFKQILAQTPSSDAVFYCGSGVTARRGSCWLARCTPLRRLLERVVCRSGKASGHRR
jgi:3-mercaptopyruvate sulfurtransferase SseA